MHVILWELSIESADKKGHKKGYTQVKVHGPYLRARFSIPQYIDILQLENL